MRTKKKTFYRTTVWLTMALAGAMSLMILLFSGTLLALDTADMQAQLREEAAGSLRCRLNTLSDVTGTLSDYFVRNGYVAFTGENNRLRDPAQWLPRQEALDSCTASLRVPENLLEAVFILGKNDNQIHYVMEYNPSTGRLERSEQAVPALDRLLSSAFGERFSCLYEINRMPEQMDTAGMDETQRAFAERIAGRAVYVDINEPSAIIYLYEDAALPSPAPDFSGEIYNSRNVPIWRFAPERLDTADSGREVLASVYSIRYEIGVQAAYAPLLWVLPAIMLAAMLLAFGIIRGKTRRITCLLSDFHEVLLRQARENKLVQAQRLSLKRQTASIRAQVFRAVSASVISASVLCALLTAALQTGQMARLQDEVSDIAVQHIAADFDAGISEMQMLDMQFDRAVIREIRQNPAAAETYADMLDIALANTAFQAMTTVAFITDTDGEIVYRSSHGYTDEALQAIAAQAIAAAQKNGRERMYLRLPAESAGELLLTAIRLDNAGYFFGVINKNALLSEIDANKNTEFVIESADFQLSDTADTAFAGQRESGPFVNVLFGDLLIRRVTFPQAYLGDTTLTMRTSLYEIQNRVLENILLSLLSTVAAVIAGLLLTGRISHRMLRQLNSIQNLLLQDSIIPLEQEKDSYHEIDQIVQAYNQMTRKVQALIAENRRQQQAVSRLEMKTLQYQINPHLIANSLALINAEAMAVGNRRIQDMTLALSNSLRYVLRGDPLPADGPPMMTLAQEMEYIRNYVRIHQIRFPNRLELSCDIDEAAPTGVIPHLLLQPLIENAIKHGNLCDDENNVGRITVSAHLDDGDLCIRVQDNGAGLTPSELAALRARLEKMQEDAADGNIADSGTGIGLSNVVRRLNLLDPAADSEKRRGRVVVESAFMKGFCVTLRVPQNVPGNSKAQDQNPT